MRMTARVGGGYSVTEYECLDSPEASSNPVAKPRDDGRFVGKHRTCLLPKVSYMLNYHVSRQFNKKALLF
jgi:hypothetical protein